MATRNLNTIAKECMAELDKLNIRYGNVIRFEPNSRAKKRWGQCRRVPTGFTININVDLLDVRNPIEALKTTIIHELLHTCEGCMNHGATWKSLAAKVNRAYGYNIKATSSASEKGVTYRREDVELKTYTRTYSVETYKYAIKCESCGCVIKRKRMSNAIKYTNLYRCGLCGGKLKRIDLPVGLTADDIKPN